MKVRITESDIRNIVMEACNEVLTELDPDEREDYSPEPNLPECKPILYRPSTRQIAIDDDAYSDELTQFKKPETNVFDIEIEPVVDKYHYEEYYDSRKVLEADSLKIGAMVAFTEDANGNYIPYKGDIKDLLDIEDMQFITNFMNENITEIVKQ